MPSAGFDFDVAVVGLEQAGLTTSLAFSAAGCRVLGVAESPQRLKAVRSLRHGLAGGNRRRLRSGMDPWHPVDPSYELTADLARAAEAAAVIVAVPVPEDDRLLPDLRQLRRICAGVVRQAVAGQLIVLVSTTYVGATRELLVDPLAARGLAAGRDVFVAFSRELTDPEGTGPGECRECSAPVMPQQVHCVVGGATEVCGQVAAELLGRLTSRFCRVATPEAAERTSRAEKIRAADLGLAGPGLGSGPAGN